ncbi:MAG: dihydrolipoyl dehydrogenase [Desulfobacterales bacterium]|nr:dihydrolipoyl dehydrogenase [Desulfobacterales bacterium]MBS3755120.1 dihydrolipoyl dehydrogenase [Desulfobacterales bacterium]
MKPENASDKKTRRSATAKSYDLVVIGSGSGMQAVENAIEANMSVALVDNGPAGGTCLNLGCIPSKMMIAAADRVMEIREASRFSISAEITGIDFKKIMQDMKEAVVPDHRQIHQALQSDGRFDYYEGLGHFTDDRTLEINGQPIRGETIFIASGARPKIPDIKGLESMDYLTSDTVLDLEACPESLAIIGGGYIAAEYGHFFSAMGADVTVFQNQQRLVPTEEPEVCDLLAEELQKRLHVELNAEINHVAGNNDGVTVTYTRKDSGSQKQIQAERVLVAAGRQSNADRLAVANTGVQTDENGFIRVDSYLQTTCKDIWAFGDANGQYMFTHVANAEAAAAWRNAIDKENKPFDYHAVPRAVFTHPAVASVGMNEAEARKTHEVLVGTANYDDCAKGMALRQDRGFAKVILDRQSLNLLGFHIIGPHAPVLIQEVINAMAAGGDPGLLVGGMHIHPALSELVMKTFSRLG